MGFGFFALISRMKYIGRWGLMRNSEPENIQEHSHMVAVLAHALAVVSREIYGLDCDPEKCASLALFHDASEIITGDLPTPIKYHNRDLCAAYQQVEELSVKRLVSMLPVELKSIYEPILTQKVDERHKILVKAADKLAAYIKCVEERKAGNNEFSRAEAQTRAALEAYDLPAVSYFLQNFMPAFELTLDELGALESVED